MISVLLDSSRFSKRHSVGIVSSKPASALYPVGQLTLLSEEISKKPVDHFPLEICIEGEDDTGKAIVGRSATYLVFSNRMQASHFAKVYDTIEDAGYVFKAECCFIRYIEEMFLKATGRWPIYSSKMSYDDAVIKRFENLGDNVLTKYFCWDRNLYGQVPSRACKLDELSRICEMESTALESKFFGIEDNKTKYVEWYAGSGRTTTLPTPYSPSINEPFFYRDDSSNRCEERSGSLQDESLLRFSKDEPRILHQNSNQLNSIISEAQVYSVNTGVTCQNGSVGSSKNIFLTRFRKYSDVKKSNSTDSSCPTIATRNVPEFDDKSEEEIKLHFRIINTVDRKWLIYINSNYFINDGVDPLALLLILRFGEYRNVCDFTYEWYQRNKAEATMPLYDVSETTKSVIRSAQEWRIRAVYQLSGLYKNLKSTTVIETCKLCSDVNSHFSKECIRYPTYEDRLEKTGSACKGCGVAECELDGKPHKVPQDGCTQCGRNGHRCTLHVIWLCDNAHHWAIWRKNILKVSCLFAATATWSKKQFDFVSYHHQKDLLSVSQLHSFYHEGSRNNGSNGPISSSG